MSSGVFKSDYLKMFLSYGIIVNIFQMGSLIQGHFILAFDRFPVDIKILKYDI